MVSNDSIHTLQWRSIYKARTDSLHIREQKVRILVAAVKVYYHYSREEGNAEGQLDMPLQCSKLEWHLARIFLRAQCN